MTITRAALAALLLTLCALPAAALQRSISVDLGTGGYDIAFPVDPPPQPPPPPVVEGCDFQDFLLVATDGGPQPVPYYRTRPLWAGDAAATRAVIVIHGVHGDPGSNPSAEMQCVGMRDAASAVGASAETLVIAPAFLDEDDVERGDFGSNALYWRSSGWKFGRDSRSTDDNPRDGRTTSFDVIDTIVQQLRDASRFPSLRSVVVAGHSAGGQFVNRYAAANRVHELAESSGLEMSYVVANPSTYMYPDERRFDTGSEVFARPTETRRNQCSDYNDYYLGTERPDGYAYTTGSSQLSTQLFQRRVTTLLGSEDRDACDPSMTNDTCVNALQGKNRLERGLAYHRALGEVYGRDVHHRHVLEVMRGVGHSSRSSWGSPAGRAHIFGDRSALADEITAVSPPPTGAASRPEFAWFGDPDALSYELTIWSDGNPTPIWNEWVTMDDANCAFGGRCRTTPANLVLPQGDYHWQLRAWTFGQDLRLSDASAPEFRFSVAVPTVPSTTSPSNETLGVDRPTYRWEPVPGATHYRIFVRDSSGRERSTRVTAGAACPCKTRCSAKPALSLYDGTTSWWIRAENTQGQGEASAVSSFEVQRVAPKASWSWSGSFGTIPSLRF